MSPRPTVPAQRGLWGHQEPLPAPKPAPTAINDIDLFVSVVKAAQEPGYVVIGPAEKVYRREPSTATDAVATVPRYESNMVSQMLDTGHLTIGGHHHVTYGDREGPARSVLVPARTRQMITRWANLRPLNVAAGMCKHCGGAGAHRVSAQARWSPERGVYRPTGTTPCHHCQPNT